MLAPDQPPVFLQLLSHKLRWQILKALANSDLRVNELVQLVQQPQNLVSYHLTRLRAQNVIRVHRSIADRREIYYSLDLDRVKELLFSSGGELHPALKEQQAPARVMPLMDNKPRVLFLCTHNSARSQMAEGILRIRSEGCVEVFSAGTEPSQIHPLALQVMEEHNISLHEHYSKSLDQFIGQQFDFIITVCDRARESCPVFPGDPVRIHWSIPDPAEVDGADEARYAAFKETALQLTTRIGYLLIIIRRNFGIDK